MPMYHSFQNYCRLSFNDHVEMDTYSLLLYNLIKANGKWVNEVKFHPCSGYLVAMVTNYIYNFDHILRIFLHKLP